MILIAHRGLYDGPNENLENTQEQIVSALEHGFHAEIDVRYINGEWWLGHDWPSYKTSYDFLLQEGLWVHCKDMASANQCAHDPRIHFFFHQTDDLTLTSRSYLWTYPNKPLFSKSVWVQPEWNENWQDTIADHKCVGICSKHVMRIRELI